ncbi:GNAT family N-acetyltransferase [Candidatus Acetothermia bacterium]|jgi:ribosomal protein S18 acetylase RimI-like enzyme|nr:GNAT family N-acetyltransferase [Candidatus Acetothermia bacterium]MCI2426948.1 GNAT family N-acetyltransferase [Candidatus Acetothermia bacterium]MCI2428917.1 GNAT family N-acetyltransferase [Candidatus Acetothermia bacterium]
MQNKIKIRRLTRDDYEALCALWKEAGLPFKPNGRDQQEKIAQQIESPCSIFLAAEQEGEFVGVILGTHDSRKGWINRLAVSPRYQQQGIATRLVSAVEEQLREQGIEIIAVLIEDWNKISLRLFERLGYMRHDDIVYYTKRKDPKV